MIVIPSVKSRLETSLGGKPTSLWAKPSFKILKRSKLSTGFAMLLRLCEEKANDMKKLLTTRARLQTGGLVFGFVVLIIESKATVNAGTMTFKYDALNRLSTVAYVDNSSISCKYDAVGNWTTNTVTVMTDSDGDGIPDWWMIQYFGHSTGQASDKSRANDDADGDGMTNLQEFLAGTSPVVSASVLRISTVVSQGSDMVFTFATATNRLYSLEWTTDLRSGIWTSLPDIIAGDGTVQQVKHAGAAGLPKRFYRIKLLI